MSDDAKKIILARRARFVAAAMASVGIACGKTTSQPGPCLSVAAETDAQAEPKACLSFAAGREPTTPGPGLGLGRPLTRAEAEQFGLLDAGPSGLEIPGVDLSADAGKKAARDAGIPPVPKPTAKP